MPHAHPLPAHLRAGAFHVSGSGLSRSRLRASDLVAPAWGLRASAVPDVAALCRAWTLRLPWYAFFARETAARLHGIPLPPRLNAPSIHVGVRAGRRRVDASGVAAHHFSLVSGDVVERMGLRVTSLERSWVDLATALTLAELVAAGDFVLWRKHPQSTRARLADAVDRHTGRRGYRNLVVALPLLSDHADSPPESEIRVAILAAGLPAPEVNVPVLTSEGLFVARPDLSCRRFRTAIDYEGLHHLTDRRQWHTDIRRFNDLQKIRWSGIRATAPDYSDPADLLDRLAIGLENAGWDGQRVRHW